MLIDEHSPVEIVRLSTAKYYHCFIHMALKQCMTVWLENLCFKRIFIHIINASINLKGILRDIKIIGIEIPYTSPVMLHTSPW